MGFKRSRVQIPAARLLAFCLGSEGLLNVVIYGSVRVATALILPLKSGPPRAQDRAARALMRRPLQRDLAIAQLRALQVTRLQIRPDPFGAINRFLIAVRQII
jgi:hypothetical protein